jgi:hypothetical protein
MLAFLERLKISLQRKQDYGGKLLEICEIQNRGSFLQAREREPASGAHN